MTKRKKLLNDSGESIPGGTHPFFYHTLISNLTPGELRGKTVLDVGCGRGINGYLLRASRDLRGSKLIGIDINDYYLSVCKKHRVYDKLIKHNLPTIPLADKSVDFVICSEVIEHLKKKQGEKLEAELERVCKGRIIVTTPNLFFDTVLSSHEDEHHSLWTISDFKDKGYQVYGMGFKVALAVGDPLIRFKQALYFFMTPFSYLFPQMGAYIIAVKDVNQDPIAKR